MPVPIISASMLYDLVACPHRGTMDLFEDPAKRDEVNAFVQLLWKCGSAVEQQTIRALAISFVNLQLFFAAAMAQKTREAMAAASLIYKGRIEAMMNKRPNPAFPRTVNLMQRDLA